jgi:uncharacterized protein (TIGR01777 family)
MSSHIVIAGGTGFIGRRLAAQLAADGNRVSILTRQSARRVDPVQFIHWSGSDRSEITPLLDGADALINLCGETIAGPRWSDTRKSLLIDSRVTPTETLLQACAECSAPPGKFLSASGVGFYGTGDNECSESSPPGNDFLADLAQRWEAPLRQADVPGMAMSVLRLGVVLSTKGGALPQMLLPFRTFIGGPMGNGLQWLSWIHLDDVIAAIRFLLNRESLAGTYNVTAPEPVRNHTFAETAAKILQRPNWVPLPKTVMQLLLGEQATLVCDGQRALPAGLLAEGFEFGYPNIDSALRQLLQ